MEEAPCHAEALRLVIELEVADAHAMLGSGADDPGNHLARPAAQPALHRGRDVSNHRQHSTRVAPLAEVRARRAWETPVQEERRVDEIRVEDLLESVHSAIAARLPAGMTPGLDPAAIEAPLERAHQPRHIGGVRLQGASRDAPQVDPLLGHLDSLDPDRLPARLAADLSTRPLDARHGLGAGWLLVQHLVDEHRERALHLLGNAKAEHEAHRLEIDCIGLRRPAQQRVSAHHPLRNDRERAVADQRRLLRAHDLGEPHCEANQCRARLGHHGQRGCARLQVEAGFRIEHRLDSRGGRALEQLPRSDPVLPGHEAVHAHLDREAV